MCGIPGQAFNRLPPREPPATHCTSQVRIALAFADESARKRVLGRKLAAFTQHSIGTPRPFILKLQQVAAALSAELNCRIYYERGLVK